MILGMEAISKRKKIDIGDSPKEKRKPCEFIGRASRS
jgi:hypothetical protein